MNTARLCLGASVDNKEQQLRAAFEWLTEQTDIVRNTPCYLSDGEGSGGGRVYLNQLVDIASNCSYEEFYSKCKSYESAVRRRNANSAGVSIDIDIVEWNDTVLRTQDAESDYYRLGLKQLK